MPHARTSNRLADEPRAEDQNTRSGAHRTFLFPACARTGRDMCKNQDARTPLAIGGHPDPAVGATWRRTVTSQQMQRGTSTHVYRAVWPPHQVECSIFIDCANPLPHKVGLETRADADV